MEQHDVGKEGLFRLERDHSPSRSEQSKKTELEKESPKKEKEAIEEALRKNPYYLQGGGCNW